MILNVISWRSYCKEKYSEDPWHAGLLPAMEKMGRTAQLLLTPDQVMLVQLQDDGAEGSLVKLELPTVCSPHLMLLPMLASHVLTNVISVVWQTL
jgi:hypothetical protein